MPGVGGGGRKQLQALSEAVTSAWEAVYTRVHLPSPPGALTPTTEARLSLEFDGFVNPGVPEFGSDPWEQRVISRALGHNLVPRWVVPIFRTVSSLQWGIRPSRKISATNWPKATWGKSLFEPISSSVNGGQCLSPATTYYGSVVNSASGVRVHASDLCQGVAWGRSLHLSEPQFPPQQTRDSLTNFMGTL